MNYFPSPDFSLRYVYHQMARNVITIATTCLNVATSPNTTYPETNKKSAFARASTWYVSALVYPMVPKELIRISSEIRHEATTPAKHSCVYQLRTRNK